MNTSSVSILFIYFLLALGTCSGSSKYVYIDGDEGDIICHNFTNRNDCISYISCGWCINNNNSSNNSSNYSTNNSTNNTSIGRCISTEACNILHRNNSCNVLETNYICDIAITVGNMILFMALVCSGLSIIYFVNKV